ncbi:hypothetical protein [Haloarcula amylovorans]|uniref:hypothetical protein n=1 Tax=Haloarcula amylovorans TaxID=2562280 RepID=UPI0010764CC1|nr:hypothetical protein [Halomicroarcula amylolytica]
MPDTSSAPTPGDAPTPSSSNATNGTAGDAGGGLLPSPKEAIKSLVEWAVHSLVEGATAFLELFNRFVFGIRLPGRAGEVATWGPPETGLWSGAWALYWTLVPLALALLIFQAMRAQGSLSGRETKVKLGEIGKCAALILAGWPVAIGGLYLADGIAMALAPDASALLSTPGNIGKLGLGILVGGALITVQSGLVLLAVAIVFIEQIILIAAVAGWPIWWGLRPSDSGFANAASGIGLSMYVGVAGAKVVQACIAFFVFHSEWSLAGGVGDAVLSLLGSAVGLGVAFVGVPVVIGRNFVPEVMTVLGTPGVKVAESSASVARDRAGGAAGTASNYASSARSRAATAAPSSVPSPTWSRGSSEASAARTVPDDYTPSPEPGARQASSLSSPDSDASSNSTTNTSRKRRIEALNGRY